MMCKIVRSQNFMLCKIMRLTCLNMKIENCVCIYGIIYYFIKEYMMYQESNGKFNYRIKFKFNLKKKYENNDV